MIPRRYIQEWSQHTLWRESYQVEQDLLISRMLIHIFSDEFLSKELAFRGGTALHKLYMNPAPRYSEDIDLVQLNSAPIGPVMKRLKDVIDFFEQDRTTSIKGHGAKAFYKFISEEQSLTLKIKIEINCQEHNHRLPLVKKPINIRNPWFEGEANVTTFQLNELLGTKLRALYQRNKGRDLFDLHYGREHSEYSPEEIIKCFHFYMRNSGHKAPTARQYEINLDEKINDRAFLQDMQSLLRAGIEYNIRDAHEWIMDTIICKVDQYKPKSS